MSSGGMVVVFVACAAAMLMAAATGAGATQYSVGGGSGWAVPAAGAESYNTWAEKTSFQIGDQLLFVYRKDADSVLQVEAADYNACNTSSYDKRFDDGSTAFDLDRAGAFFFISGVEASCRANEKLIVMVANAKAAPPAAPAPAQGSTPATPASPTTPSSSPPSGGQASPSPPSPPSTSPPSSPNAPAAKNPTARGAPPTTANGAAGLTAAGALAGWFAVCMGYAMLAAV